MKKKRSLNSKLIITVLLLTTVCFISSKQLNTITGQMSSYYENYSKEHALKKYAKSNNIAMSEYPDKLLRLYKNNPETKEFVFNYPLNKMIHLK